jgi:predicted enzyme related to lactoylglutathione lyase
MEGQPSVWITYASVDDAEATVERAKKAGAMVFVELMDVSDIGRMAVMADPTGAAIGVWQPTTFKGAERPRPSTPRCSDGRRTTSTWGT